MRFGVCRVWLAALSIGLLAWGTMTAAPVAAQSPIIPVVPIVVPVSPVIVGGLPSREGRFGPVLKQGRASVDVDIDRSQHHGQVSVQ
jgi:hypothetical protein